MRFIEEVAIPFTGDECLTWPFGKSNNGYARIGKGTLVTRLVCEAIHGKPAAKMDAAHSCGNGHLGCVNPKHLRWATHLENGADMAAHGRTKRGRKHFACKLTEDSVRQIRALRGMLFQREIAAKFGITRMTVNDIHSRRNWAWLDD